MNARILILGLSAGAAMLLAACSSGGNTQIYDPATTKTGLRATKTVSSEEMPFYSVSALSAFRHELLRQKNMFVLFRYLLFLKFKGHKVCTELYQLFHIESLSFG